MPSQARRLTAEYRVEVISEKASMIHTAPAVRRAAGCAVQAGVRIIAGAAVLAVASWACALILGFGWSGIPGAALWKVLISAPAGLALFALGGYTALRLALV
jgi:hypothetical protein